jgi:hypothetical protein
MSSGIITGNVASMGVVTTSLNVASVAANTTAEQTFTITGLRVGDFVTVSKPSLSAGLGVVNARVSAADTLAISFVNATASPIDPAAESYLVLWVRPDSTQAGVAT